MAEKRSVPASRSQAVTALYRTQMRLLYAFIYGNVGNRAAAEEISSEVFTTALMHLDPTWEERSMVAWLYRVARKAANDYWRRHQGARAMAREEACAARRAPVVPEVAHQKQAMACAALLARLPENYRAVLTHRVLEGVSVAETAGAWAPAKAMSRSCSSGLSNVQLGYGSMTRTMDDGLERLYRHVGTWPPACRPDRGILYAPWPHGRYKHGTYPYPMKEPVRSSGSPVTTATGPPTWAPAGRGAHTLRSAEGTGLFIPAPLPGRWAPRPHVSAPHA